MLVNKNNKNLIIFSDEEEANMLENYYFVEDNSELAKKLINNTKPFDFILEDGKLIDIKILYTIKELLNLKLEELEKFIKNYRSQGIEWNNQLWSIDEECEKNLTAQITLLSFAPVEKVNWFSKSQVNELTINEFKELALVLSNAISNAKMKYYVYKNAIENATNEEELDAITFE